MSSLPDRCPDCGATTRHGRVLALSIIAAWCQECGWSVEEEWSDRSPAPPPR